MLIEKWRWAKSFIKSGNLTKSQMVLRRVYQLLPQKNPFSYQRLRSRWVGNRHGDCCEQIIKYWGYWCISNWTRFEIFHTIFLSYCQSIGFTYCVLICAIQIDLVAHKYFERRICFLVDLNPFFHILKTLPFGNYVNSEIPSNI